jgi:hypothetical protein
MGLTDAASQQVVSLLDARAAAERVLSVQPIDGSGDVTKSGADIDKFLRYSASVLLNICQIRSAQVSAEHAS